jgi:hypothetical protein
MHYLGVELHTFTYLGQVWLYLRCLFSFSYNEDVWMLQLIQMELADDHDQIIGKYKGQEGEYFFLFSFCVCRGGHT